MRAIHEALATSNTPSIGIETTDISSVGWLRIPIEQGQGGGNGEGQVSTESSPSRNLLCTSSRDDSVSAMAADYLKAKADQPASERLRSSRSAEESPIAATSRTADAKAAGASCGRLCPMPPPSSRCS